MTEHETQLGQRIERDVRQLIGDLHVQIIALRNMMDMGQQAGIEQPKPVPPQAKTNGAHRGEGAA